VPSLRLAERRARAAYFVLRGTPAEALPLFEEAEEPVAVTGWARGEGVHARAHNDLGDHERAREICSHALARLSAEDLRFPALNLGVSIELARAEAALGNVSLAEDQLRALLAAHEDGANPLTMGALHEACAEVASRRGDQTGRLHHVLEVERWYRPTKGPSLIARCQRLARDASLDQSGSGSLAPGPNAESSHVRTVVRDERGR
jgi:hypothetical protein